MDDQDEDDDDRQPDEDDDAPDADEADEDEGDAPNAEFDDADESAGDQPPPQLQWKQVLRKYIKGFLLERASSIAARPVEWLWEGRIPKGHLTLLAGDADVGKSLVALDLAARVSTGAAWPAELAESSETEGPGLGNSPNSETVAEDEPSVTRLSAGGEKPESPTAPNGPANVLILTTHENPRTTLRPRLGQAGADLTRIYFATGMPRLQAKSWTWRRQIRLPDDILSLAKALIELAPVDLVILDPAWAYCSRGRGRSRLAGPAQLADLADLATKFEVAIVCVTDLRRVNRGKAAYQVAGSRALTAAARAGWGVLRHPRDRDRRVLLPLKMNLGPPVSGLEFQIHERGITWEAAPAKVTAEAVFAGERAGSDQEGTEQWLRALLADGSRPVTEIREQAKECGLSFATLRRAKESLGVISHRIHFEKGKAHWKWSLGEQVRQGEIEIARIYATG